MRLKFSGAWMLAACTAFVATSAEPALSLVISDLETMADTRHFDVDDGLSSEFVVGVALDTFGTVWAGTRDGLSCYDGAVWRNMPIPAKHILTVEPSMVYGAIVGTGKGAYSFTRTRTGAVDVEVWTPFEHPYLRSHADSLTRAVYAVNEGPKPGALWFGTQTGAKHYGVFEWIAVDTSAGLPVDEVTEVLDDGEGTVWLATPEGLFARSGDTVQPTALPEGVSPGGIHSLALDPVTGALWAGTEAGAFRKDGDGWQLLTETGGMSVETVLFDRDGTLYAGADFTLFVRFADGELAAMESSHRITDLALGRLGELWISTYGGGLHRWAPGESGEIGWTAGPVTDIVVGGDGVLRVAAGNGVWTLSESGVLSREVITRKWTVVYDMLVLGDGSVWLGTDTGAYREKDGRIMMSLDRTSLIGGAPVHSLALDDDGVLWIGAESGVFQLHLSANRLVPWRDDPENTLYPIAVSDDGTLWMGASHGVYAMREGVIKGLTRSRDVVLGAVRAGAVDTEGAFWFGDDEGHVVRAFAVEDTARRWEMELFGAEDGIRGKIIRRITPGPDGSLWIATDCGVNRYRDGLWGYYGRAEGLRNRNAWAAVHALPGVAFVGGERGLELLRITDEPPETRIISIPERVAPTGNLMVLVRAADMWKRTPGHSLRYSWRLDGESWSELESFPRIVLTDVPSGEHRFEVRSLDGDLNWDPTPATATFTVDAPLWRRWYVIGGLVVVFILGIVLVRRYMALRRELESLRRQFASSETGRD